MLLSKMIHGRDIYRPIESLSYEEKAVVAGLASLQDNQNIGVKCVNGARVISTQSVWAVSNGKIFPKRTDYTA